MRVVIESISEALGGVSNGVVYAVIALAVVQIGVQIWALVDLARRPQVAGGRKWLWALVIIFLSNLALGAILYFAIGRKVATQAAEQDAPDHGASARAERAVDTLYGAGKGDQA